jgi:hypothetical protein
MAIERRSLQSSNRWTSGFEARGKRDRKNSGIASWRSSRIGTPASRKGSAANASRSGGVWTWTSA